MTLIIGIDVGGTNLRLGIVQCNAAGQYNKQPKLLDEIRLPADFSGLCKTYQNDPDQAWRKILSTIADAIHSVRTKYPAIAAVGIGFPGFIDPHTQKISLSPNLPGLSNVDLSTDLGALIALPVVTENDALAAAYGEFAAAAESGGNLIYLGLGTGVGGGLILNGQPLQGQHGVAMEAGHIITVPNGRLCGCGNRGCMEQYASASGVAIGYEEATGEKCTAAEIAMRAKAGDGNAIEAYRVAGATLAQALAHILKIVDVADVVIGGGMSGAWPLLEPAFRQQLGQDLIPALRGKVNVHVSDMGDCAGMIGAAMLAQRLA